MVAVGKNIVIFGDFYDFNFSCKRALHIPSFEAVCSVLGLTEALRLCSLVSPLTLIFFIMFYR